MMSTVPSQTKTPSFTFRFIGHGRIFLLNKIAQGVFGDVFVALGPSDPSELKIPYRPDTFPKDRLTRVYAVKRTKIGSTYRSEITSHQMVSDHPHIVTLYHVFEENGRAYLVMDYHPHGDLAMSLYRNPDLYQDNQLYSKRIFLQLLEAVQHCHSRRVYHRDIKPENVLLADLGGRVILADFGLSTRRSHSIDFETGSPAYMSPECLGQLHCARPYSPMANDVWGLGVIIFHIVFGVAPWSQASTASRTFLEFLIDPDFFLRNFPISIEFNRALMKVFSIDPTQRVSVAELIPIVQGIDVFSLRNDPRKYVETRTKFLRPLDKRTVKRRIRGFADVLDSERFLRELRLSPALPIPSGNTIEDLKEEEFKRGPNLIDDTNWSDTEDTSADSLSTSSGSSSADSSVLETPAVHTQELLAEEDIEIVEDMSSSFLETSLTNGSENFQEVARNDFGFDMKKMTLDRTSPPEVQPLIQIEAAKDLVSEALELQRDAPVPLLDFMGGQFGNPGGAFAPPPRHISGLFSTVDSVFGARSNVRGGYNNWIY